MRVRKVLVAALAVVLAVVIVLVGAACVDFGVTIYAEYRLARTVRQAAHLGFDPFVAILGFPVIPQALRDHYNEVEIKASAVDRPVIGKATLEATMHSVDLTGASWLVPPDAKLRIGKLESRIIIDSLHLGRYMGMRDLMVEAPPQETNNATGGTTESGISSSRGLVFTGTPASAHFNKRVSVAVDLSMAGDEKTTLVFTPTGVLTGPDTANQQVPNDKRAAVLAAFAGQLPNQTLPFAVPPTSQGARGSDVIIEGISKGLTITLDGFNRA
jgi:hypothetical protein